nr:hypothetical protein [uncultured Rhodopila sp.]
MQQFHRLEDAIPAWRAKARLTAEAEPRVRRSAEPDQPRPAADSIPYQRIAAACLAWMTERGCWPNQAADKTRVANEIEAALRTLVLPSAPPRPSGDVRGSAWAITAAVGSALGALLVSPLTFLWFDNRLIGLFLGGTLGAFLAVRGVSALLERPRLVAVVRSATTLSSGGVVMGGVWRAIRGEALGLSRSVLWLMAVPLVLSVLKPRSADDGPVPVRDDAARKADIARAADIALAVAWAHPERLAAALGAKPAEPDRLPHPVIVALTQLQSDIVRGGSDKDVRESCDDLMQRLQESGYEWTSVPKGTAYEPEMAGLFEVFGSIPAGASVRTQRAAMTRDGQLVHKGELRRV